jgi:hypothetical protein
MKIEITTLQKYIDYIYNSTNVDVSIMEENMSIVEKQFEDYLVGDTIASYESDTNTVTHTPKWKL